MTKPVRLERRHFAYIANVVRQIDDPRTREVVADAFCDRLGETNPNFDPSRFLAACHPRLNIVTAIQRAMVRP